MAIFPSSPTEAIRSPEQARPLQELLIKDIYNLDGEIKIFVKIFAT
jgi:hypothetical protein